MPLNKSTPTGRLAARALIAALMAGSTAVAAAQTIELYEHSEFRGQRLSLESQAPDLAGAGMAGRASSLVIHRGSWELCTQPNFRGTCITLGPGRYDRLPPNLNNALVSVRPLEAPGRHRPPGGSSVADIPPPPQAPPGGDGGGGRPWASAQPAIVFYEHSNFSGRRLPLVGAAPNFQNFDFNDRASAVEVFRGRWQICRHADFSGACSVVGPGRYTLDGRLQNAVSSARPLFGRDERPLDARGAVTLHDDVDFRGRSVFVDGPVMNLRERSFNDSAVTLEVHAGRWELCSDADFSGRCWVFGPGWHRLPDGLAYKLSSLRPR